MAAATDGANSGNAAPGTSDSVEQRYRLLLEHSPDPMCVHADGLVVYVNPAGLRGIGAERPEQLVGRMITDFVHPDSIAPMLERIAELRDEGDSSEPSEAVMLRLDGSPVDAEAVSVLTRWEGKPAYQVIFRDLTTQKAAEATLRYQAALVTHVTDAIIATTADGVVTSWNPAAEAIYRRPAARALARPISEAVGAETDPAAIIADGGVHRAIHQAADGSVLTVRVAASHMDGGYVLLCSDHTALRRAEQRFETVVDSLDEGVMVLAADGRPEWINPAAWHILGVPEGTDLSAFDSGEGVFPLYDDQGNQLALDQQPFARTVSSGDSVRNEVFGLQRLDGRRLWVSLSCGLLDPTAAGQSAVLVSFTDITDQHNAHLRMSHQAHHDALTGLPNRAHAEARVAEALQGGRQELGAVMFIDLDNVKMVNDALGHQAGDTVITAAAHRLQAALRSDDFVARLGGDEYLVLLFGRRDRSVLEQVADRLHAALAVPLMVAGSLRSITASIGVTEVAADDPRVATEILHDADVAMYKAKASRAGTRYA